MGIAAGNPRLEFSYRLIIHLPGSHCSLFHAIGYNAPMIIKSPAAVTGDGAKHALSSISGAPTQCKWFIAYLTTGTSARIGDANVSSTRGAPFSATIPFEAPPIALAMEFYDLTQIFYFVGSSDVADFVFGV